MLREKLSPERVEIWNKLKFVRRQHEELDLEVKRQTEVRTKLNGEVVELEAALAKVQKDLEALAQQACEKTQFTAEQQHQFDVAQQEADRETAEKGQIARELDTQSRLVASDRAHLQVEVREAEVRCSQLVSRAHDLEGKILKADERHEADTKKLKQLRRNLRKLTEFTEQQDKELELKTKEKEQIHKEIQHIAITEKQIEREKQLQQISDDLQRVIPGVHGRVVKLCRACRPDLSRAVHVALNGYLDAIVVDSADVGRQCVQYLKDRRLQPMTFLPMSSLGSKVDARLRDLVSNEAGLRMALSCITVAEELHVRVFEFLLGNVVVADAKDADNLKNGKEFFFERSSKLGVHCRVVTLQGETISVDGNIAVNSNASGHTAVEFTKLDERKRRLNELAEEICQIQTTASAGHNGRLQADEDARALQAKVEESHQVLSRFKEEWEECRMHLDESTQAYNSRRAQLDEILQMEQELQKKRQDLEEEITQAASRHFAELSRSMGVPDIRQHERQSRQDRAEAQRREDDLLQREGNVKADLLLKQQALREKSERESTRKLAELTAEIQRLESDHRRAEEAGQTMASQAARCDDRIATNRSVESNSENKVLTCRQSLKKSQDELATSLKRLSALESEVQSQWEKRLDLLRQSVFDGVELPLSEGQDALRDLSASDHSPGLLSRAAAVRVCLHELDRETQRLVQQGSEKQRAEEERFRADLKRLAMDLERSRPNLKAMEQLRQANEEVDKLDKDVADAQRAFEEAEVRFEAARKNRRDAFIECFKKVADEIDPIYKALTANTAGLSSGNTGGSAYLDLENQDDPFLEGVNFTAMPPAKRFSELGQLSGGEKAMAALALLFAVYKYQHPPFLMLDEVDAHLDNNNMHALATFMRSFECQTIVISLKEQLFTQCEGMVGVSKNASRESSCIFTFDLEALRSGAVAPIGSLPPAPGTPPGMSPGARMLVPVLDRPLPAPRAPASPASPAQAGIHAPASPVNAQIVDGAVAAEAAEGVADSAPSPATTHIDSSLDSAGVGTHGIAAAAVAPAAMECDGVGGDVEEDGSRSPLPPPEAPPPEEQDEVMEEAVVDAGDLEGMDVE